ncbi:signal peptidase I [Nitrosopumilus sp.]|uniref:signal peptidase I n=1 Tax=Nitrosopumilus sp. TaxID=2024843 RepID=UPI00344D9C82
MEESTNTIKNRSPLWYELPLIFTVLGGIIAYFKIKNDDPKKARNCLILGIILTVPLFLAIGFVVLFETSTSFYVVASDSMNPTMEVYDLAIISDAVAFDKIEVGDIIVFDRPSDHNRVIVHRVASIIDDDPKTIRTQGDANPGSIPGTDFPITEEEYIGKVSYVLPQLGYVTQILKPPVNNIINVIQLGILLIPVILHVRYKKNQVSSKG